MPDSDHQLKLLIAKRENLFEKTQLMYDTAKQAVKDKSKLNSFSVRYSSLEAIYSSFIDYDDRINLIQLSLSSEYKVDHQKLTAFEGLYYSIKTLAMNLLVSQPSTALPEPEHNRDKCSQPRLPQIDIPTWDSSLKNWVIFYDKFNALIHSNQSISPVEKFHYLMQSVSGPALTLIKSLPLTATNYPIVWNLLVKKYHNKRVLGADILDRIFNCPNFSVESITNLNSFIEVFCEGVTALKAINIPNLDDFLLLQIALKKLPFATRKQFENQYFELELPSFSHLASFIENQAKILEISKVTDNTRSAPVKVSSEPSFSSRKQPFTYKPATIRKAFVGSFKRRNTQCPVCHASHSIYKCSSFLSLSPSQRRAKIRSIKYCFNCLRGCHMVDKCPSQVRCSSCNLSHHSLLHSNVEQSGTLMPDTEHTTSSGPFKPKSEPVDSSTFDKSNSDANCNLSSNDNLPSGLVANTRKVVLLGTAIISIRSQSGTFVPVRALIDSGSQTSFITSACAQRLGLMYNKCDVTVAGLAQRLVSDTKGITSCIIKPCSSQHPQFKTDAIVLKHITSDMPSADIPNSTLNTFRSLKLADPKFDTPAPIDFLIAADIFPFIFDGQRISSETGLTALHSVFGWVITGQLNCSIKPQISSLLSISEPVDELLKKFWEVEEPPSLSTVNPDEVKCEEIFQNFHNRAPDGRYIVPLPFRNEERPTSTSYSVALKRLLTLEKRFHTTPDLRRQYQEFLDDYEKSGHMTKVLHESGSDTYYIPHHAVTNANSTTTKLRVVFDGSTQCGTDPSLNQLLHIGPKLQNDIVHILINFMFYQFVFIADICQMYRQILVRPEDRRYQHILWRRFPDEPLQDFELNTVTYGLTPSPYLALRTLRQLALDEGANFPSVVDILYNEIYIDDVISGGKTKAEARERMLDLTRLLRKGGFELRKWASSCPDLLTDLPAHFRQSPLTFNCDERKLIKILGVQWDATTDSFTYRLSKIDRSCTKRIILSHIARIYDPIGWLSPITFRLKCLIQHLWRLGLNWDDKVPNYISEEWLMHCDHFHLLSKVSIPRYVLASSYTNIKLVGFCDASERGYGAVIYLCTVLENSTQPHLILAKSKVAPLKTLSIPRLELCAAVLLATLLKYCLRIPSSYLTSCEVHAFSDSTTVLSWLRTPTHQLKTFVASRVNRILEAVPPAVWCHVSSALNPADCASRGLQPQNLLNHTLWWKGPEWLSQLPCNWPLNKTFAIPSSLPELKGPEVMNTFHTVSTVRETWIPISKFSSLTKLLRVTAWCFRFLSTLKCSTLKVSGPLTTKELDHATSRIVREVQWEAFPEDMRSVLDHKDCSSQLRRLCPFLDPSGCLRVGGRLNFSHLTDNSIHPLILPKKSHFTNLVIDSYHRTYLHAGPRVLQSFICRKYWILSVRNVIRSRLAKCNTCFKCKPLSLTPKMADLPPSRVIPSRPFLNVGIDFGGPFLIKESRRRNAKISKSYLALFVCMATKAVHLEAVSDLSTRAFLAAFDRFVARRGLCVNVYTDCGSNFIGARRYLNELYEVLRSSSATISDHLSQRSINWFLNIPTASHWGGLWEAGIRCTKYHLKRVLHDQALTFEELASLFCRIEAVLNSRPLCSLSPDPTEINVLTPGHFLIGSPIVAIPEADCREEKINRLDRWQLIQRATQHFWDRWSREYLHTLQQRVKWFTSQNCLQEGDIVLIISDRLPATYWSLGRVKKLVPGKDGIARAASVVTPDGKTILRPLVKLCPLPSQ